jgi:DNA-binding LacI/PurR family transcriptional regulator
MSEKGTTTSRLPAYLRLARVLGGRIREGVYCAGEFLPTERELATENGLSRQTVRLAVEQLCREGLVRPEDRRGNRILDPSEENVRGTGLAALVIYDMSRGGATAIFRGVQRGMHPSGYPLIVCETPGQEPNAEAEHLRRLIDRRVEGILLYAEPTNVNRTLVEEALSAGIAVVQIDRFIPGLECDYVGVDNGAGARDAVQHLVEQGHRRIALLSNQPPASTVMERAAGYEQALAEAGLEIDACLIGVIDLGRGGSSAYRDIVRRWMTLAEPPSAVFAINDTQACGLIQALRAEGYEVPRDVAVVGFDNQPYATLIQPALTTVAQPFLHLGEMAARLLLDRIQGEYRGRSRRVILPTQLIIRDSTAIVPRTLTRVVSAAL